MEGRRFQPEMRVMVSRNPLPCSDTHIQDSVILYRDLYSIVVYTGFSVEYRLPRN